MARAIGNGVLSFGLVSIPVEIHSAIQDQGIHMHLLHKKCGSRVRNKMMCTACKVVEERADLVCNFELSKGNYVQIPVRSWRASRPRPTTRLNSASSCRSTNLIPFI